MIRHILKGWVQTHLWAVIAAAGLRNQKVMVDYVPQLLLLLIQVLVMPGEIEHADSRGNSLPWRYFEKSGIVGKSIAFARRKVSLWACCD
jgi:hypothetical protein